MRRVSPSTSRTVKFTFPKSYSELWPFLTLSEIKLLLHFKPSENHNSGPWRKEGSRRKSQQCFWTRLLSVVHHLNPVCLQVFWPPLIFHIFILLIFVTYSSHNMLFFYSLVLISFYINIVPSFFLLGYWFKLVKNKDKKTSDYRQTLLIFRSFIFVWKKKK